MVGHVEFWFGVAVLGLTTIFNVGRLVERVTILEKRMDRLETVLMGTLPKYNWPARS